MAACTFAYWSAQMTLLLFLNVGRPVNEGLPLKMGLPLAVKLPLSVGVPVKVPANVPPDVTLKAPILNVDVALFQVKLDEPAKAPLELYWTWVLDPPIVSADPKATLSWVY